MSSSESTNELKELIEQLREERKEQKELMEDLVAMQKRMLERTVFYGESQLDRANWMEWRDSLRFESEWNAPQSLQASYKCWKLKVLNTPSRIGDDRDGLRGSPWSKSDERKADLELPDELLAERVSDFPERLWRQLGIDEEQWKLDRLAQVLQKRRKDLDFELEQKKGRSELEKRKRSSKANKGSASSSLEPIGEQAEQVAKPEEQAEEQAEQEGEPAEQAEPNEMP